MGPTQITRERDKAPAKSWKSELLQSLGPLASRVINAQLVAFSVRLTDALMAVSEQSGDSKTANLCFNAANLLKNNGYAFYHLASTGLEKLLADEISAVDHSFKHELAKCEGALSLVPYEEMDNKVLISTIGRPIEASNADELAALNIRIACLLDRDEITTAQNPFRPAVFLSAMQKAWCEFDPNTDTHQLILPLMRPDVFLDLAPLFVELNQALIAKNIIPGSIDAYRIKKTESTVDRSKKEVQTKAAISQQLKRLFSPEEMPQVGGFAQEGAAGIPGIAHGQSAAHPGFGYATAASAQLLSFLADFQSRMPLQTGSPVSGSTASTPHNVVFLPRIKAEAPKGSFSHFDEKTIDLLTQIFDTVFLDQHIPGEIKQLIGFLQIPVLKAALIDKEFFFKEEHPARRLIEILTKSSLGWNQKKGQEDPLFQAMKRNVDRVQKEFEQEISVFADVVSDLESYVQNEEVESTKALSAPISVALKQEKIVQATKSAKNDVSVRIGTGEVVAFVETFLEKKWVPVLTIAYSLKDEKPQALESAIKTMDDLIWSVKPKITMEQRKELIAKLPSMLAMLNKWINVVKWEDADRLQFFAELAECHASIVRAPIELSPERQLEIAMEVAKKAAERRLEKRANPVPEPVADESVHEVDGLKRGMWLEFTQKDDSKKKLKLAWVSPLRSLYIFTTNDKQEAFSLSSEDLAQQFRENKAQVVLVDGLIDRALTKALKDVAVNDDSMSQPAVA